MRRNNCGSRIDAFPSAIWIALALFLVAPAPALADYDPDYYFANGYLSAEFNLPKDSLPMGLISARWKQCPGEELRNGGYRLQWTQKGTEQVSGSTGDGSLLRRFASVRCTLRSYEAKLTCSEISRDERSGERSRQVREIKVRRYEMPHGSATSCALQTMFGAARVAEIGNATGFQIVKETSTNSQTGEKNRSVLLQFRDICGHTTLALRGERRASNGSFVWCDLDREGNPIPDAAKRPSPVGLGGENCAQALCQKLKAEPQRFAPESLKRIVKAISWPPLPGT